MVEHIHYKMLPKEFNITHNLFNIAPPFINQQENCISV